MIIKREKCREGERLPRKSRTACKGARTKGGEEGVVGVNLFTTDLPVCIYLASRLWLKGPTTFFLPGDIN